MVGDIYRVLRRSTFIVVEIRDRTRIPEKHVHRYSVLGDTLNYQMEPIDILLPTSGWSNITKEYILMNGMFLLLHHDEPQDELAKIGRVNPGYLQFFETFHLHPVKAYVTPSRRRLLDSIFDVEMGFK